MAELNNEPQPEPTPTPPEGGEPSGDAGKQAVIAEAARWKKEAETSAQALADFKAKQTADNDAAEKERLAKQGEWQKLAETEKEERAREKAEHAATLKRMSLDTALLAAGVQNQFTRAGIIASCPADAETADFMAGLQKDQPELFKAPEMQGTVTPAQGGRSSGGSTTGVAEAEALMAKAKAYPGSVVPSELEKADQLIQAHHKAQGATA